MSARFAWIGWTLIAPVVSAMEPTELPPAASQPVDFARDVKTIFTEHCFSCHGPEKQRSGYRLDVGSIALLGGDGSAPNVIPGKSAESPLIRYVAGLEEDMLMPPKGDPLTPAQIGILRAWIDQGAPWPEEGPAIATREDAWRTHWAFQPLARPVVPPAAGRGAIDAFLMEKLATKGLAFAPEADRRTLVRRLHFALIGLPPTPAEIEAFVADPAPDAYERLVERLLSSPHYGERWGRHWLDVVRFAESDGYQRNNLRQHAWPYRDYVIRAFNEDTPYDRFIKEQIAGDAYGADAATGFIVGGAWDVLRLIEPPSFDHQQRADELYDMVGTTGSTFMGLTVGCARCHDHKFDPISQRDFYSLTAVFQGVFHGERPWRPENYDALLRETEAPRKRIAEIDAQLATFTRLATSARIRLVEESETGERVDHAAGTGRGQASDHGDELRLPTPSAAARVWSVTAGEHRTVQRWAPGVSGRFRIWASWSVGSDRVSDASYAVEGDGEGDGSVILGSIDQSRFADGSPAVDGEHRWSGFHAVGVHTLTAGSRIALRSADRGGTITADTLLLEEVDAGDGTEAVVTPHLRPPVVPKANEERFAPSEARFVRFTITGTNGGDAALDEIEVFPVALPQRNIAHMEWGAKATGSHVGGRDGNPFYINDGVFHEVGIWSNPVAEPVWVQLEFPRTETIDRIVWSRNRSDRAPKGAERGLPIDYRIDVSVDGSRWQTVASSADRLGENYRRRVTAIPTLGRVPAARAAEVKTLAAERRSLRTQVARVTDLPPVYAGRFADPLPSYRLHRGEASAKRERVAPAAIAYFSPNVELSEEAPEQERRIALAEWISNPKHPLTARVMVNRLWHYHFGTGLVDTPSDFGINGGRPSHPELLDWLAGEFIARGWSVKAIHRLIVNSAAYRQSAAPRADGLAADSGTRLLWRFPPRRLEAEPLRDAILAASGTLSLKAGGPGFSLFVTDLKNAHNTEVFIPKTTFGADENRRMIYQQKPRVQLDDVFGAFDCPDAGQVAPARTSTTTPLQAFNLLNSPFALDQAARLADRLRREAGADPAAQISLAFALVLGRPPEAAEAEDARTLIAHHGLALFCRSLFNTNEFVFVY
jgi:mono/diheme cytochrome c family protein